jgi:hypothetical protein
LCTVKIPWYLLQLPAGNVVPLSSIILWIVKIPWYLLQLGMSFLYLPLFCGLSNTLISAPAGNVVPLSSTILWIVKISDICSSLECPSFTFHYFVDCQILWSLLQLVMLFLYLPLFCGLSNYPDICSSLECPSFTFHYFVDGQIPWYLLQLVMLFLYLPLFCGLSKSPISAPAWNVLPLPSTILWIVKYPDICSSW